MSTDTTTRGPDVALRPLTHDHPSPGARVWIVSVDGREVGMVGDERPWRGHRFGALRWWAALRDMTDLSLPARWRTDEDVRTRKAAVAALVAALEGTA